MALVLGLARPGPADEKLGRVSALACQANLDSFPRYKCRYTITLAEAASTEEALRGEYTNARRYDHWLVVDGGKEKLETLGSAKQVKVDRSKGVKQGNLQYVPLDWVPLGYLQKGEQALNYTSLLQVASLYPKEVPADLVDYLPLSMATMGFRRERSPAGLLKKCDDGKFTLASAAQGEIDKQPVVELAFANEGNTFQRFYLDVQQGYLPRQIVRYVTWKAPDLPFGKEVTHTYLLEAKEFSKDRWFPMHTVMLMLPFRSPARVIDIRVTELEVDKRPADSDFALSIPAGTEIKSARDDVQGFFRLKQDEKLTPDDLPRLFQMLENAQKQPRMDTAVHPPRASFSWAYWAAGGAFLLTGLLGWVWHRRRQVG